MNNPSVEVEGERDLILVELVGDLDSVPVDFLDENQEILGAVKMGKSRWKM